MTSITVSGRNTRATTVRIPSSVYEEAKILVESERSNSSGSVSLNDFFVTAIQAYVALQRRHRIDAAFAGMAQDAAYQREANLLSQEFEPGDWEALRMSEEQGEPAVRAAR